MTNDAVSVTVALCRPVPVCEHEFGGWRSFDDGRGGEQFCQKCGLGALNNSIWDEDQ